MLVVNRDNARASDYREVVLLHGDIEKLRMHIAEYFYVGLYIVLKLYIGRIPPPALYIVSGPRATTKYQTTIYNSRYFLKFPLTFFRKLL